MLNEKNSVSEGYLIHNPIWQSQKEKTIAMENNQWLPGTGRKELGGEQDVTIRDSTREFLVLKLPCVLTVVVVKWSYTCAKLIDMYNLTLPPTKGQIYCTIITFAHNFLHYKTVGSWVQCPPKHRENMYRAFKEGAN